jgi:hypothetical protein
MDQVYYLQLHGKLAEISEQTPVAKVNLKWINEVEQHKWYIGSNGYPFAYIKGARVPLHRFIHWLINGYWTDLIVDHIDRDKFNATDSNLREATAKQNSYNKTHTNPNHNIKYNESTGKFTVKITKDKIVHKIDDISTIDEAKNIYKLMAEELFGEFAPV